MGLLHEISPAARLAIPQWPFEPNYESPQALGLVSWYPSPGSYPGNTLLDRIGQWNSSAFTATWSTSGLLGHVLTFDQTLKVEIADNSLHDFTSGEFSVVAWIYPDTWGQNLQGRIVDKGGGSSATGWAFYLNDHNVSGNATLEFNANNQGAKQGTANAIALDVWQHVVVTIGGGNISFYVNGEAQGGYTGADYTAPANGTNVTRIGLRSTDTNRGFEGNITDVRFYNWAIPASLVKHMYNPPTRWDLYQPVTRTFFFPSSGAQTVTLPLLGSSEAFYTHTVTPGAVTVTTPLLGTSEAFYTPQLNLGLTLPQLGTSEQFYVHTVTPGAVTVTTPLLDTSEVFYTHQLNLGLTLPLLASSEAFYTHTVSLTGAQTVTLSLLDTSEVFYTHQLNLGLTLPLLASSEAFYTHQLNLGLTLPLLGTSEVFYTHTLTPGAVTVTLALLGSSEAFYTHQLNLGLVIPLLGTSEAFYTHQLNLGLTLPQLSTSEAFYVHVITGGAAGVPGIAEVADSLQHVAQIADSLQHTASVADSLQHTVEIGDFLDG